jgi:hypothetical protein
MPGFQSKTRANEQLFDSSSLDVLFIRVGGLTAEYDYSALSRRISLGDYVHAENHKRLALSEFRQPQRKGKSSVPSYFVSDDQTVKTLSGNPIIVHCLGGWWDGIDEAISCEVNLSIPKTLWPPAIQKNFGGVDGLGLTYRYAKKHLPAWRQIHEMVLNLVDEFLTDVSLASSR